MGTLNKPQLFLVCTFMAISLHPVIKCASIPQDSSLNVNDDDPLKVATTLSPTTTSPTDDSDTTDNFDSIDPITEPGTNSSKLGTDEENPEVKELPEGASTDDTNKIELTTESNPSGNDNSSSNSGERPVFEMVDVVLRPSQPPVVLIMDFFLKPNNTLKTGGNNNSEEDNSTEMSSESNKDSTSTEDATNSSGAPSSKVDTQDWRDSTRINVGQSEVPLGDDDESTKRGKMTPSSGQTQVPKGNGDDDDDDSDDAQRKISKNQDSIDGGNDDKVSDSFTQPSTSPPGATSSPTPRPGTKRRQRRETHQTSNISNGDDNTASSDLDGTSTSTQSSGTSEAVTGKFQLDDDMTGTTTTTSVSNNDADSDDNGRDSDLDDDDGGASDNVTRKSGTVKIFLEILQLVPLSNSTDDGSPTGSSNGTQGPAESGESGAKPFIHSLKANSNQKSPIPSSTTAPTTTSAVETPSEVGNKAVKRVVRQAAPSIPVVQAHPVVLAVPAPPAVELKLGNPSTSRTTSAPPSSTTTGKPLTGKDAPAAPVPSTKTQPSSKTTDDSEGPPLLNVTEESADLSD